MVDLVYCGLFSSCFKWVMDHIISPLGKLVADVLGTVLTWLFNNILAPVLKAVFTDVLPLIFDLIYRVLADIFYGILSWLLQLLEVLTDIFDLLAGLRDVTFNLETGSRTGSLTMVMFQIPALRTAFLAITLTAVLLTFCTAAYAGKMGVGSLDTYRLLLTVGMMEGIPSVSLKVGETRTLDLKEYFLGVSAIAYSCTDSSVVEVSVSKGVLTLVGKKPGEATVSVSDGTAVVKTIEVSVK